MKPLYVILSGAIMTGASAFADTNLPTVTIMGKTFYTYVAKKGESFFGIANRFGWDPEILANTNRELDTPLSNGDLIYYPVPKTSSGKSSPEAAENKHARRPKKETVAADNEQPLPVGPTEEDTSVKTVVIASEEPVMLDPLADKEEDGIVYHKVRDDESLYGIALAYETTVEDLYKMNPGLSYQNPEPGETIRLKPGSRNENATPAMVTEEQLSGVTNYKVRRGDDWNKIAEKFNISVDLLKQSNPDVYKPKRGDTIMIPTVETVEVERMVVTTDPREETEEGRKELYNEVHSLDSKIYDADGNISPNAISVAIVLDNPESNRDMEFARGALVGVDKLKNASYPIRLTIIDGTQPKEEVIGALDGFNPTLIITTADKDLPQFITAYAKENGTHLVNSFDVKNESYLTDSSTIQYLAPTSYFNEEVADHIASNYTGYNLIIAGKMEGADTMGESIIKSWVAADGTMPEEILIEEIETLELPEEDGRYLIYGTPSGKEDVKAFLAKTESLRDRYPLSEIRVIGRPNWVTMADGQRQAFENNGVLLPTRFYFNADSREAKDFIEAFKGIFGHTPMKSYPVYSVTAFDIISYFLPNISMTGGDFNAEFRDRGTLQSPISLERVNNWGGVVNPSVYLVEFRPFGGIRKIILNPAE